jgi:predicted Zn-dependent peptidase
MYQTKKNKLGPIVIASPIKGIKTVTILVLFGIGSKYENKGNNGAAHFVEHMLFKGTIKRPNAKIISEDLDKIGGEYNAFTSKEYTGYYVKVNTDYFNLALDWISDIVLNSQFDEEEMNKERGVILEEMNMCQDNPMEYVGEVFESLVYGNQPAGWEILGTKKNIKSISRNKLFNFKKRNYLRSNCVICLAGNFEKDALEKTMQKFSKLPLGEKPSRSKVRDNQKTPRFKIQYKKTDQSHCILGFQTVNLFDKRRYPLNLLAVILGKGMSSRLFSEVREKRGLAYHISADSNIYTDSGYLAVQAGLDSARFEEALKVILQEFYKIAKEKVEEEELKKAKEYLKGMTSISMESSNNQASYYGNQQLLKGKIETLEEKFKILNEVTSTDILKVAKEFLVPSKFNLAVISSNKDKKKIEKIIKNWYK